MSSKRKADKGRQIVVPAARLDSGNKKWGLWVSPHLWLSSDTLAGPPSRWHQWWQHFLLGWRWEARGK